MPFQHAVIEKLIMLRRIKMPYKYIVTILCMSVVACQAQNNDTTLPTILFENGEVAANCEEFNTLKQNYRVEETVNNQNLTVHYLPCSLDGDAKMNSGSFKVDVEVLENIMTGLKVRQLPTSLSQTVTPEDTFKDAGFEIDTESNSLTLTGDPNRNFRLILKGQQNANAYTLWVFDEILDASYKSYYPVNVTLNDDGSIDTSPVYESGY